MKKKIGLITCAVSMLATEIPSVFAENVAIQDDVVFIVENSLAGSQIVVKNLADNTNNACLSDAGLNLLGLNADTKATDIAIKNTTAVVTTYNSASLATDVKLVNVSGCMTAPPIPVTECITTISNGLLTIPCVQYNGQILSVILEQRGNSMNWELKSSPILNDTFKGYHVEDDEDEDHSKKSKNRMP
ncbi:MAG: hypothetical protein ACWA6R_07975 [Nitrosomonas sp.]